MILKRAVGLFIAAALCLPAVTTTASAASSGPLISATPITALTRDQVAGLLTANSIDPRVVKHGVDAFRLEYRTVDPHGRPTIASGAVVLPRSRSKALRMISFEHGTIAAKKEAPSVGADTNRLAPITFAAADFAVVAPDYLGLGTGAGVHPYAHLPSETTASVDLLRAADTFIHRKLDRKVFVTGFSQGGPAAMSLGRRLQKDGRLAAVAGISGFYDLFGTQFPEALDDEGEPTVNPKLATISSAYYLVAMNRIYHLYRDPARAFNAKYASVVAGLFDGHHSGPEIAAQLPNTPRELLTKWAIGQLLDPSGPMRRAAQASDGSCAGWTPRVPVRLYAATGGDELVPFGNSQHCQGLTGAPIVEVGRVDHNASARLAYPLIIDFFEQTRG
jgi:pimeloyl-ACP methyl ester carboxylesterase